jgi:hypothetical protein
MVQVFGTHNLEHLASGIWHLASGIWHLADIGSLTKYFRNTRLARA